ncbi:MAG: WD40 repeat domain-containing protein, partial [Verrucomicrobia bacterium]|nr:WD40 repeat domain-containing protein [Verrucomicrobiota bacterium]
MTAVPPTVGYRLDKFVRRHRAAVAGAVLTLTALVAGLVVSVQQAARARSAERSTTLTLADMHTRSGLAADAAGDPSRAALWFASAAVLADADPARREANRRRAAAWRPTVPTPVRALESGFSYIGDLLWNPRHAALVVGSDPPGRCLVWDLSADRLWTPAAAAQARRALWDPTGERIAIAADSQIRILDYPAGREIARRDGDAPTAWAFHPTAPWLAIGDPRPLLWNWQTGEQQSLPTRHQVPSQLEFNRDGSRLLIAWPDAAGVVATDRPDTLLHPMVPNASLRRVLFLGEGDRYVTSGSDGSVQIRDTRQGDVVDDYPGGDPQRGAPLAASPDGRFLARDSAPALDLNAKTPMAVPFHKNLFQAAAFGPDSALLVTGGYDDVLSLWDLSSDRPVETVGHHQHAVLRVALSPDAGWVASSQDGLLRVWWIGRPSPMTKISTGADSLAALSPDGLLLAPSGLNRRDGALARTRAYQLPAGTPAGPELEPQGLIMDAGFPPDSRWLALAVSTTPNRGQTP